MDRYSIVKDLFQVEETVMHDNQFYVSVYHCRILDYQMIGDAVLETVTVEHIIDVKEYLEGRNYLSVKRKLTEPFPDNLKGVIAVLREIERNNNL